MANENLLQHLISALQCLPGVGPKTAQRMALHLLERDRSGASDLAAVLEQAVENIGRCEQCRNLTENPLCSICSNPRRESGLLCIVESPADVLALEQATGYKGLYFVLLGRLSPLDGIGPEQLGLEKLAQRLKNHPPGELIIATNSTVEGEATAFYIQRLAEQRSVPVTRIAQGVPLGSELEFADQTTLAHAFGSRQRVI